jgi:hypothetical protein
MSFSISNVPKPCKDNSRYSSSSDRQQAPPCRNGWLHATMAHREAGRKPNRIWLAQGEEEQPRTKIQRWIKSIVRSNPQRSSFAITRGPGPSSHQYRILANPPISQLSSASTRTAVTVTDPSRRRTEHQHRYDLSFLLPRNTYKRR